MLDIDDLAITALPLKGHLAELLRAQFDTVGELDRALKSGRLREVDGIGEAREREIADVLKRFRTDKSRRRLSPGMRLTLISAAATIVAAVIGILPASPPDPPALTAFGERLTKLEERFEDPQEDLSELLAAVQRLLHDPLGSSATDADERRLDRLEDGIAARERREEGGGAPPPIETRSPPMPIVREGEAFLRVVDVGSGLCCVARIPGPSSFHYLVFDTGGSRDAAAISGIAKVVPSDAKIDLLVLSHNDADHIGGVPALLERYHIKRVLRPGAERNSRTWREADSAIQRAVEDYGLIDFTLREHGPGRGLSFALGGGTLTVLSGFAESPESWGGPVSYQRNGLSIVARLAYGDASVLLTGDAIGRAIGASSGSCGWTEAYLISHEDGLVLASDVLIVAGHGSDSSSSTPFLEAVGPDFAIFPAGHAFRHPRVESAKRILNSGVDLSRIFRTDRGDDEGWDEWDHERVPGEVDPVGDDDVDIILPRNGPPLVGYTDS